jgi:hypothetical protein
MAKPRTIGPTVEPDPIPAEPFVFDQSTVTWEQSIALEEQAGVSAVALFAAGPKSTREAIAVQWIIARANGTAGTFDEFVGQPVVGTEVVVPEGAGDTGKGDGSEQPAELPD